MNQLTFQHDQSIKQYGLALLQDARVRTLEVLENFDEDALEWEHPQYPNSIATILYHIAAIEADWLYFDVLERDFPAEIIALFPYDVRTDGRLTPIHGIPFQAHFERLAFVRDCLMREYQAISESDFLRVRQLPHHHVSPEWVLHHLAQHEAEHRNEIRFLITLYRAQSTTP